MKYMVIGLGNFGSRLASTLTRLGHEVIGIDKNYERLEEVKDSITTVIKMDTTNINALKSLPLNDIDAVIVAIGEDVGASVLTASILRNLKVKRIIGRAVDEVHNNILNQIGIEEVALLPEDSAINVASMLLLKNTQRLIALNDDYAIAEIIVPTKYAGHTLEAISISERFKLTLVAVKIAPKKGYIPSLFKRNYKVEMSFDPQLPLGDKDILVLAGKISDIQRFTES